MVQLIQETLEGEGFSVLSAQNGAECLRVVAEEHPDLVILDVEMPLMDGFQVLRALRLKHATRDLPVVMLTVRNTQTDMLAGLMKGADEYLTKPCRMEDLVAAVKRNLPAPALQEAQPLSLPRSPRAR
jgi:DNA-binding response OmpR family regulator